MKSIIARTTLISLFLGLAVVTQGQAEDYYIYQTPNGALVISNKEPPPGSKIIKQQNCPGETDSEVPQAQEPDKTQPNAQTRRLTEAAPRPSRARATRAYNNSFKPVADCIPGPNLRRLRVGLHVQRESFWPAA